MPLKNIYKQGQPTDQADSGIKKYNIYMEVMILATLCHN
jgi:hypothetical protein